MKGLIGICHWTEWCHGWQVLWTLDWYWWLGLEGGHWQLDILWRASLSDVKTFWMERFRVFLSLVEGTKNNSKSDKRLGMWGGDKQSHWPKPSYFIYIISLPGDSCWRQLALGIMLTAWTCSLAFLKVMCPPGVRQNFKGCGALCISSHKVVVGTVLCRDWCLSVPMIFREYLRKTVSLPSMPVVVTDDIWDFVLMEPRELASTAMPEQGHTYPNVHWVFSFLVSPQTTFANWI